MKFLHKYGTRRNDIGRAKRELYVRLGMVLAVVIFFSCMLLVSRFSPRVEDGAPQITRIDGGDALTNPKLMRLREKVDGIVESYRARIEGTLPTEEDLELLAQAISLQKAVINSRSTEIVPKVDLDRLAELQSMRDEEIGAFLMAQSVRMEKEGQAAWDSGDYPVAIQKIRKAQGLQAQINEEYPKSSNRDPARAQQLSNRITNWQVLPLADKADQLQEEAYAHVEKGEFDEAKGRIREALDIQRGINRDFRSSRLATIARLKKLEKASLEIQVAGDVQSVEKLVRLARESFASGDRDTAIQMATEAETGQRSIMSRFSPPTSEQKEVLASIRTLRETASSLASYNRIVELASRTREALRSRDIDTFNALVPKWMRESLRFREEYPGSDLLAGLDLQEVAYLHGRREEIPSIMERVYSKMIPVLGHPDIRIFSTEVSQALFQSVSGFNPSSQINPLHPVESVTWEEARQFVRQLSWILARKVELPGEAFLKEIAGTGQPTGNSSWFSENSDRKIRPVGELQPDDWGIHDLLGNVAEWTTAPEGETPSMVVAFGGSARESLARLNTRPSESRSPNERNRYIGFRFIVDLAQ
jgi:tetratricopeptide (TPR) repeat protein